MKTQLDTQIELITDPALKTLTRATLDAAPSCFWTMPAATTGKYHPAISLGHGGLIRHTKAVVRLAQHLLAMQGIEPHLPEYSLTIAACILHDCCKKSDSETYTAFDHPLRAAQLIEQQATLLACADDSAYPPHTVRALTAAVASHMGRWNVNTRTGQTLPTPLTPLQRLVHTADYLASRKDITLADIT